LGCLLSRLSPLWCAGARCVWAEAQAKLRLAHAEKALANATRKRRRTDERADVKAFAVKVFEETGDAREAALRTTAHFVTQHRNVDPSAGHIRRWAAAHGAGPDRFGRTSRGDGMIFACQLIVDGTSVWLADPLRSPRATAGGGKCRSR